MRTVHQPASLGQVLPYPEPVRQACARCQETIHSFQVSEREPDARQRAALQSSITVDAECALQPFQAFDIGTELPEGFARCQAQREA